MFKDVEGLGDSFSERINDVDQCLTRITSDPPWGPVLTPTNVDTRKKVDLLARDAANLGARCSTEALDGLTLHEKLYEIETAVDGFLSGNLEGVSQEFEKGSSRLEEAQSSFDNAETTACQITMLSQTVETLKQDLEAALNGAQIGEFENNLQRLEEDLETTQLKLDVVQSVTLPPKTPSILSRVRSMGGDGHETEQVSRGTDHRHPQRAPGGVASRRALPQVRGQRRDVLQVAVQVRRHGGIRRQEAEGAGG